MKRIVAIAVLIMLVNFTGQVFAEDITIALIPKGLDNPVFEPARIAAEDEAKKLGVKLLWVGAAETDTEAEISVIEEIIKRGVDAIGISVNDATALNWVIAKAIDSGILVSTWDSDAQGSKRLFYIGTDNYKGGFQCGMEMKKLLGGKKKIAALSGDPGAFNLNERIRGFTDAVKDADIKIVTVMYCYDNIERAASSIESYTKTNADEFDGWFFVGGWPLFAQLDKLPNFKEFKGKVVCFDYFPPGKPWVEQGIIDVCVAQDFAKMGRLSVRYLAEMLRKKDATYPEINDSGLFRVDKSNIQEY
ncbi:MAG: substrate-binding domain-containing protein [Candidatus Omnitrophica bacterium]|nr:substrate-binding domain-containing protein [Candidatus Omnitrophota bacterium]